MSAVAVALGVLEALEGNRYEVAPGMAVSLPAQREGLFPAINR